MGEFLVSIQEQLDAAETFFFGFELEAPFVCLDAAGAWGGDVGDFGGDFVGCDAVSSRPGFDYFDVFGCGGVYCCDATVGCSEIDTDDKPVLLFFLR